MFRDPNRHRLCIKLNVFITEANHVPTFFSEKLLSLKIGFANQIVIPAVDLNDQPFRDTGKVSEEWANGMLASKPQTTNLLFSKDAP
jgi:hypothetical protein